MRPFQDIVRSFDGYDWDHDGELEIRSLKFLSFENQSATVAPNKKLVVVLVESRLLKNYQGSPFTTQDLLNRLITYKNDLSIEGRQSRFLEMTPYDGAIRADCKSVLAIRQLFKEIRNSFSNFEGAVLVGSFPDARVTRIYPQHGVGAANTAWAGVSCYREAGFYYAGPRHDIVLADLDGRWDTLYQQNLQPTRHSFFVTAGCTETSTAPHKVVLKNPTVVLNEPAQPQTQALPETLLLNDVQYTINKLPEGTDVEFYTSDLNPEVGPQDALNENPIATPDILVSRINARSIAVNPPKWAHALNADGQPQATSYSFSPDQWERDEILERRLLIDYFDRNHSFRSGTFANIDFGVSVIKPGDYPGTSLAYDGLDGWDCAKNDYVQGDATLLDFIHWLKRPTWFRAISAHADCDYTQVDNDDTIYPLAESAVVGRPWNWVKENGSWRPSFSGINANLSMYRTLWENRQLENVPPSLLIHGGCSVNAVRNAEKPYNDPTYGAFQNAESLLFYGNQLAVICRNTWWYHGPLGFGNAMNAAEDATFGDGWRGFFTRYSSDPNLKDKDDERKRPYEWCVVGDWTLQRYYLDRKALPACGTVALKTVNGHTITVVNEGGLGGPNNGPGAVALHTDATTVGPWERFTVEWLDSEQRRFALKTVNGNYVTAVNGGGIGGPNDATSPIHTDATWVGPWEKLTMNHDEATGTVTLQTPNGRYVTAVNGGEFGGPSNVPIHTDAVKAGQWETFTFVKIWKGGLRTKNGNFITAVNGGGLGGPNTGPQAVALHTDATTAGPWERFTLQWLDPAHKKFALKMPSGHYLSAVRGGGIGGANNASSPIHTDASWLGPWEILTLVYDEGTGIVTIQTPNGRYLTAVNGGGFGGQETLPIHTDAKEPREWETFSFVVLK